jgi:hypothetical protein
MGDTIVNVNFITPSNNRSCSSGNFTFLINHSPEKTGNRAARFSSFCDVTPSGIPTIKMQLDSIILKSSKLTDAFDLTGFTDSTKNYSLRTDPQPPPIILEIIKHTPPDLKDK